MRFCGKALGVFVIHMSTPRGVTPDVGILQVSYLNKTNEVWGKALGAYGIHMSTPGGVTPDVGILQVSYYFDNTVMI